jgi:TonB family protein
VEQSDPAASSTTGSSASEQAATAAQGVGSGTGDNEPSRFAWYHEMIHDRFYSQWEQPTSLFGGGTHFAATVQIRIERDGRISSFEVINSSGNFVMDESIKKAGQRVRRIDPLPDGLGSGGAYTVRINFELD